MSFAKIAPVGNIHDFSWFEIGEFFRFNNRLWVKYSDHCAVNISDNDNENQEFDADTSCENIDVELKIL